MGEGAVRPEDQGLEASLGCVLRISSTAENHLSAHTLLSLVVTPPPLLVCFFPPQMPFEARLAQVGPGGRCPSTYEDLWFALLRGSHLLGIMCGVGFATVRDMSVEGTYVTSKLLTLPVTGKLTWRCQHIKASWNTGSHMEDNCPESFPDLQPSDVNKRHKDSL